MKPCTHWSYTPYRPCDRAQGAPQISRLAPSATGVRGDYIPGAQGAHTLWVAPRGGEVYPLALGDEPVFAVDELQSGAEYELYITDADGVRGDTRLVRTGDVPGVPVHYLHPEDRGYAFSGQYLCSPSLVRLPGGVLLASCDVYAANAPQNLTLLLRSEDRGLTWRYVTDIFPCFWGKLFVHQGAVYMLGLSTEYGDVLIGRSLDEGYTWEQPTVILRGSGSAAYSGPHRAPMHLVRCAGRFWTSLEYGGWTQGGFACGALSIDEHDDLLVAENWVLSGFTPHNPDWPGAHSGALGGIEGNLLPAPDGQLRLFLRYAQEHALLMRLNARYPHHAPVFEAVVPFPMGHSKFEILPRLGGGYLAVGNRAPMRNVLSLYQSDDLRRWAHVRDLIDCADMDAQRVAFQYPSALLDGKRLLVLCRTAYNEPANYHDSNTITFHSFAL